MIFTKRYKEDEQLFPINNNEFNVSIFQNPLTSGRQADRKYTTLYSNTMQNLIPFSGRNSKCVSINLHSESKNRAEQPNISGEKKSSAFEQFKSFTIIIDSDTFDVLYKDSYLLSKFLFLSYYSHSLVAYNFSAQQKKLLLILIRKKFADKLNVLAIGSSNSSDASLLNQADLAIQLED